MDVLIMEGGQSLCKRGSERGNQQDIEMTGNKWKTKSSTIGWLYACLVCVRLSSQVWETKLRKSA